jgi:ribose transport system ATP-binding protein
VSIIYISHALPDVLRLCDDIVVLRDGEVVGAGPREEFTPDRMIALMVGRNLDQLFPERRNRPGPTPLLEARGVTQPGFIRDIRFALHEREVLGISGLMGSGRTELARILFGLDPMAAGQVLLMDQPANRLSTRRRIRTGVAFVTESRHEEGLCLDASIADNISLASLPAYARPRVGWLDTGRLRAAVAEMRSAVTLTPSARDEQPVRILSGGNQQKVVLAKWLLNRPRVFILDEPTRGIDVGARYEIYCLISRLAAGGAGVLVISSEIEELIGLCDRILVMRAGEIRDEIPCHAFDRERILRAALRGGHLPGQDSAQRPVGSRENGSTA